MARTMEKIWVVSRHLTRSVKSRGNGGDFLFVGKDPFGDFVQDGSKRNKREKRDG